MNLAHRLSPLKQRSFFENHELAFSHSEQDELLEPIHDVWTCENCDMLYREEEQAIDCVSECEGDADDRVAQINAYECPQCEELHKDQEDAYDCCPGNQRPNQCPCCLSYSEEGLQGAVDCCLFFDLNHAQRLFVRNLRGEGASWDEAIERVLSLTH